MNRTDELRQQYSAHLYAKRMQPGKAGDYAVVDGELYAIEMYETPALGIRSFRLVRSTDRSA